MKNLLLTFSVIVQTLLVNAQVFDVETLLTSGATEKRINLVILSDGYQENELDKFITDANSFTTAFFKETPYKEYKNYFNVFAIKVPSNESGADHPGTATDVTEPGSHPVIDVDNYFGSTFDYYKIHRLLVPTNTTALTNVLATNFPEYDQVVVLVNSSFYGGSGGTYATTSTEASSNDVAIHEIGHSFANLADEYYAGDSYAAEKANMTQTTDSTQVKWKNWIGGSNGVGIYQHCCTEIAKTWYRPHQSCMMRNLSYDFCPVCIEGTIEKIHTLVSPIDSYSPQNEQPIKMANTTNFSVTLVYPNPNTLNVKWLFNNTTINTTDNEVAIATSNLIAGENKLQVIVEDKTQFLRVDNHETIHAYTVTWNITPESLSINNVTEKQFSISLYPNPANNYLNVKLNSVKESYTVKIYTLSGQQLISKTVGKNVESAKINTEALKKGTYIAEFIFNDGVVISRKIIKS